MVEIQFYLLDVSYETTPSGRANILLFGRTQDKKRVCAIDREFLPYFYVIPFQDDASKLLSKISEIVLEQREQRSYVVDTRIVELKEANTDVRAIKVFVSHPKDIRPIKKAIEIISPTSQIREYDILFTKRYIIDKKITPLCLLNVEGEILERDDLNCQITIDSKNILSMESEFYENPKILSFDIEVYTKEKRYPIEKRDPIIMVAFSGSDGFEKVITWKKFDHSLKYLEFVSNEGELIKRFVEVIREFDPDYIVGYFSDGFDFPYIISRAKRNMIKLSSKKLKIKVSRRGIASTARIQGMPHIDVFKFVKNIMGGSLRLDSYTLGNVSKELLGEEKIDVELDTIGTVWDIGGEAISKFCEYNLKDTSLTLNLYQKIMPNLNELVKITKHQIFDVCRMSYSALVEACIMVRAKDFDEIYPNKPSQYEISQRRMQTYQGAYIYDPIPGLYDNVVVFDFASLYPSIIASHNISPTTLVKNNGVPTPQIQDSSGNHVYYFSTEQGFIPRIIEDIIERRVRVKEMVHQDDSNSILQARSYALKIIANATYGYFGFFGARWYSRECAESITAYGRKYTQDVIYKAKNSQFEVLYGDTDSIFIRYGEKPKQRVLDFLKYINDNLPGLMELELEGFYPRALFVSKKALDAGAKKKYALISEDGKIKVRGFETIRRDWSFIAKEVQNNVLSIILRENSPQKAMNYVLEVIDDIKNNNIPKDKMIIQTQLKKKIEQYALEGPHVIIAKRMRELGLDVPAGSVIAYIVSPGKGKIRDKAKLPDETTSYDPDYYINNQIIPAVDKIFEACNLNIKEDLNGSKQSGLGEFI